MSTQQTCVVISDLHLGDGAPRSESFRQRQQDGLDGLLAALEPDGALGQATGVELVVNGDCFDFLLTPPAAPGRTHTDSVFAIEKIERIIAAHQPFFAALRRFLAAPTHRLTFMIGNHDLELCFAGVRARVRAVIDAEPGRARFCLSRAYRPLPDVELEHGCQFDPWNRVPDLWDGVFPLYDLLDDGREHSAAEPERAALPWGSRYYYDVVTTIHQRYPYMEAFVPELSAMQILALLCLFAPDIVLEGAPRQAKLRVPPQPYLVGLAPGRERIPPVLFAAAWEDLFGLQREVLAHAGVSIGDKAEMKAAFDAGLLTGALAGALAEPLHILKVVFARTADRETHLADPDPAAKNILLRDEAIRIALIGHTHAEGTLRLPGQKLFLDTGTWTNRQFQPAQAEQSEALLEWMRASEQRPPPLRDATRLTFALLQAIEGGSTQAQLCEWVGGRDGSYRPLPPTV
jgi:UDP-2,3-diacylglucosamine pyrophosphatase LpxH